MAFDINLGKLMASVMKDAKIVKHDKDNIATFTDNFDRQLYYVLTSEQFDLIFKKDAVHAVKETEAKDDTN